MKRNDHKSLEQLLELSMKRYTSSPSKNWFKRARTLLNLLTVLVMALAIGIFLIGWLIRVSRTNAAAVSGPLPQLTSLVDTGPITSPRRLAIYYGWPSLVNSAGGNLTQATASFTPFNMVVLGAGLEDTSHGDHTNTVTIIGNLAVNNVDVYGYVDLGITTQNFDLPTIAMSVDAWKAIPGVTGIFYDNAGQDFGVTRPRLISAVDYVHSQDLVAFINAWQPDDVLSGATPLRAGDWYLAESHPVSGGQCSNLDFWWDKSHKLKNYHDQLGVQIATSSTGGDEIECDDLPMYPPYRQALWATYLFGFDAFNFADLLYSASGPNANRLCPLPLPPSAGTTYLGPPTGPITTTNGVTYTRLTDLGTIRVWRHGVTCDGGISLTDRVFLPVIIKT